MLKLYKRVNNEMLYWETWAKDEKTGVIHWGTVGQSGQMEEIRSGLFSNFRKTIQKETDQKIKEGYAAFEEGDFALLEIEYIIDGFGTEEDLDKRHRLEEKMDEVLGRTGLGHTNGGSIGSGTMEVGCAVVDFNMAKKVIADSLANTEFSNYARIFKLGKQVTSQVVGLLAQHDRLKDWWVGDEVAIPFFDGKPIQITFMRYEPDADLEFVNDADNALRAFLNLTTADRMAYSGLVYKNCTDILAEMEDDEDIKPELAALANPNDVWHFVDPTGIYVTRRDRRDMDMYLSVSCNCEWEEEHGLQLVFRKGEKLTRVSEEDGHLTEADAYDKPDEEDEWLSKF